MISDWKKAVEEDIPKLESGKPTVQNALLLAALYELREEMKDLPEEPENENLTDIMDEIEGSTHYLELFRETRRPEYREMAKQELSHAGTLIEFAHEDGTLSDEELRAVKTRHAAVLARLS